MYLPFLTVYDNKILLSSYGFENMDISYNWICDMKHIFTSYYCGLVTPYDVMGIVSCDGVSSVQRQAISWNNTTLLKIKLSNANSSDIRIQIVRFPFKMMHWKNVNRNFSLTKYVNILYTISEGSENYQNDFHRKRIIRLFIQHYAQHGPHNWW